MTVEPVGLALKEAQRRVVRGDLALARVVGSGPDKGDPCGLRAVAVARGKGVAGAVAAGFGALGVVFALSFGSMWGYALCALCEMVAAGVFVSRAQPGQLGLVRDVAWVIAAREQALCHGFELVVPAEPGAALAETVRPAPHSLRVGTVPAARGATSATPSRVRVANAVVSRTGRVCEAGNCLWEFRKYGVTPARTDYWEPEVFGRRRQCYVMVALDRPVPNVVLRSRRTTMPNPPDDAERVAMDREFDAVFTTFAWDVAAARALLTPRLRQILLASAPTMNVQFKKRVVVFFWRGRVDFASESGWSLIQALREAAAAIAPLATEYIAPEALQLPDGTQPDYEQYPERGR